MTPAKPLLPDECREAFEKWYSEGNLSCPSIRKNDLGDYRLMQAHASWAVWQACWNTRPAPSVPTGYKLVPIEPTEEMKKMPSRVVMGGYSEMVARSVYQAMLSAAPENKGGE